MNIPLQRTDHVISTYYYQENIEMREYDLQENGAGAEPRQASFKIDWRLAKTKLL